MQGEHPRKAYCFPWCFFTASADTPTAFTASRSCASETPNRCVQYRTSWASFRFMRARLGCSDIASFVSILRASGGAMPPIAKAVCELRL